MGVQVKVWFTADTRENGNPFFRYLLSFLGDDTDLPFSKDKSIVIETNIPGDPDQPYFRLLNGVDPSYNAPYFKTHYG